MVLLPGTEYNIITDLDVVISFHVWFIWVNNNAW